MSVTPIERGGTAESATHALRGFVALRDFVLSLDPANSRYSLRLKLTNAAGLTRTLLCRDVQNLELNATGEGFNQLSMLRIEDVTDDELDRIRYTVDELETEAIFLHCGEIEVLD